MAGLVNIKDKARGLAGPNHVIRLFLLDESDFLSNVTEWPQASDVAVGGEITALLTTKINNALLTAGLPSVFFAIQTGKAAAKKNKGKGAGYENYSHDGLEGEIVGVTKEQWLTIQSLQNKPVVVIAELSDGTRRVFGSKAAPLQVLFEEELSMEGATLKVKFDPTGVHSFMPVFLGAAAGTITAAP